LKVMAYVLLSTIHIQLIEGLEGYETGCFSSRTYYLVFKTFNFLNELSYFISNSI